jgi:hypothetical protein
MSRVRVPLIASGMIIVIAACSRHDPVANDVKPVNLPLPENDTTPDPLARPPQGDTEPAAPASPTAAAVIPAAIQGRWGLSPGDCTSHRGDAKGLLVISASELRFYESRAVPSPGLQVDSNSVSGNFRFTGEGQSWTKYETIELRKNRLVRTESNPAASYTYAKC